MRKLISVIWIGIFLVSCCFKPCKGKKEREDFSLFAEVPITKFSPINAPCLDLELDGKIYSATLDLGFRGFLSMPQSIVDQIPSKKKAGHRVMYGIRGKEYLDTLYELPRLKIGNITFFEVGLQGEEKEFCIDAVFGSSPEKERLKDLGRLGWCLFRKSNLLIDVCRKHIVFCNSLENLRAHGYLLQDSIEVPMLLERGLVEFNALTPQGPLRCMLDTGATLNMMHSDTNQTIDEAIWDPKNTTTYSWFKIGNKDVGKLSFRFVPIQLPIHIEAILGMEFFLNHVVFLDFAREKLIFAKSH